MADDTDNDKSIGIGEVAAGVAAGGATALVLPRVTSARVIDAKEGTLSADALKKLNTLNDASVAAVAPHADSIVHAKQEAEAAWNQGVGKLTDAQKALVKDHTLEKIGKMSLADVSAIPDGDVKNLLNSTKTNLGKVDALTQEAETLSKITGPLSATQTERLANLNHTGTAAKTAAEGSIAHAEHKALVEHTKSKAAPANFDTVEKIKAAKLENIANAEEKTFVTGAKEAISKASGGLTKEAERLGKIKTDIAPVYKEANFLKKTGLAFKTASVPARIGLGVAIAAATLGAGWAVNAMRSGSSESQGQSR